MSTNDYSVDDQEPYVKYLLEEQNKKLKHMNELANPPTIDFEIGNTQSEVSEPLSTENSTRYQWRVYVRQIVNNPEEEIIERVIFKLHPTFDPSTIRISEPLVSNDQREWAVERIGWGEFRIQITVCLKTDGDVTAVHNYTHNLNLRQASSKSYTVAYPINPNIVGLSAIKRMEEVRYTEMHGVAAKPEWEAPILEVDCDEEARPGYNTMKAHEYEDDPRTLKEKIKFFAELLRKSNNALAYTGAGISTSAGIDDYASKAKDSKMKENRKKVKDAFDCEPSLGHRALTQLWRCGILKHWVQQNHDGLPQKAGFPQHEINEIHGAWYDPSNPVVPMSGTLRSDLFSWMHKWQKKTDLCIAMGTSLCGMNADNCVDIPSEKYIKRRQGYGSVIVGLQRTIYDKKCSLRIFAKIDTVMAMLMDHLKLKIPAYVPYKPNIAADSKVGDHQYKVPYDEDGQLSKTMFTIWDLRPGQKMVVCAGPGEGFEGTMDAKMASDYYILNAPLMREGNPNHGKGFCQYAVGTWWIETATKGLWSHLPMRNEDPEIINNSKPRQLARNN